MNEATEESRMCLALVKPGGSALRNRIGVSVPVYGIYEYDRGFGSRELRFGDGSWIALEREDMQELILLPQFDEAAIDALFNY